jgi:hypothetical protein
MQEAWVGNVGDFGKFALLRHLVDGRRLAICWYLTKEKRRGRQHDKHFYYLKRPGDFRHLAPEVFDALKKIVDDGQSASRLTALETSGLVAAMQFHGTDVPERRSQRETWAQELADSVSAADLVYLDPDNGIQGKRLTPKHVALQEIAALRQDGRVLVIGQRQAGRQLQAKFLVDRMRSVGCRRVELIRFRLVSSRFYVVADHEDDISERIASFSRKWGNWVRTYAF